MEKERPKGYEFIEKYKKFASCEYCCKTQSKDDICNICFNNYNYEYYVDEENRGRCAQKCSENYGFIRYDKKICVSSCNDTSNCNTFNSYLNIINSGNKENKENSTSSNNENNTTKWCLTKC